MQLSTRNGFITLVSTLVAGAVGLSVALSLILLGLGTSRTSFTVGRTAEARGLVNACAEEALQKIRESLSFSGTGGLTIGSGSCSYTVTIGVGENRHIDATGTADTVIRKLDIDLDQIKPTINITLWQEVAD